MSANGQNNYGALFHLGVGAYAADHPTTSHGHNQCVERLLGILRNNQRFGRGVRQPATRSNSNAIVPCPHITRMSFEG